MYMKMLAVAIALNFFEHEIMIYLYSESIHISVIKVKI